LLNQKNEALVDYREAIKLREDPDIRANLGDLLHNLGQRNEALTHLYQVLKNDPTHATTHSFLANVLEPSDPETALRHREIALEHAPHDERARVYCKSLAALQSKLGRHADAIRSYRRLIALAPTSPDVNTWKSWIAAHRRALDAEALTRTTRENLLEQQDIPLPHLASDWLRAAGLTLSSHSSAWLVASGSALTAPLPVVLMPEPIINAPALLEAFHSLPPGTRNARQILVLSAAEILSLPARHQLAAFQEQGRRVALLTAPEVREAFLQGNRACSELLGRAFRRIALDVDPFLYKGPVQEHTEFFGRTAEIPALAQILGGGQQVGLYGIHKIGKSSLLEQLRRKLHLAHPEITVVQIELHAAMESGNLYADVLRCLPDHADADLPARIDATSFRRALETYHRRAERRRPGHRVLLILDEYAYLIPRKDGAGGMRGSLEALGLFKAMFQEGWFSLLPCGRTAALSRQASFGADENPFLALVQAHFLGPLTREETDALMETLGVRAGISFTPDALSEVFAATGGHPGFSRDLGSEILRSGKGKIDGARARKAVESMLTSPDRMAVLRAIYEDRLDEDEKAIALELAGGPLPRKELFAGCADIPHRVRIRDAIENLVATTVLVEADGKLDHRYGLLRRVIQRQAEELGL
jgi:hypothetical protein